VMILGRSKAGG